MKDPRDIAPKPADAPGEPPWPSNVLPLFSERSARGRRRGSQAGVAQEHVDSAAFVRHDSSPELPPRTTPRRDNPTRRQAMPRLARQALELDASSQPCDAAAREWVADASSPPPWGRAPNDRVAVTDRQTRLTRTLEFEIIPRLVDVHRVSAPSGSAEESAGLRPTARDVEEFVQLVLARDYPPAQAFVDVLGQRGMSVDTLYLDLLAPAAQHLNYLWMQDLCDFTHVTIGLARLQQLLHELSASFNGDQRPFRGNARRVLLLPACGEQQTFGLSMVAEFFHHAGWEVDRGHAPPDNNAVELAHAEWFDVIGLAAGSETRLQPLRRTILDVRQVSRNKDVCVMVSGPIFAGHPERVKFVGADACGLDGKKAPVHAEQLIALRLHSH